MRFDICLCVFIVLIHEQMLIFPCSLVIVCTRLLCAFYNKRMHIFYVPKKHMIFLPASLNSGMRERKGVGANALSLCVYLARTETF